MARAYWFFFVLVLALTLVTIDQVFNVAAPAQVSGTVTGRYVTGAYSRHPRRMVEITTPDGVPHVLEVRNSPLNWFAAERFAALPEGRDVTVKTTGYRLPGYYPRVKKVSP